MVQIKQLATAATFLAATAILTACGSLSHNIAQDGSGAESLVWPAPTDTTPMHKDGTWPTVTRLRQLQAGLTKNQIMALIGPPHFSEGAWAVREWNYLFHLHNPHTGQAQLCQYKVLFDDDMRSGSDYWQPLGCAALVEQTPVAAAAPPLGTLSALFAFDKWRIRDMNPDGLVQLHDLVGELEDRAAQGETIRINGYTDPIGGKAYNKALSQKRAASVRQYLMDQGVPAQAMIATGYGASQPVADCQAAPRAQLVACLAPDRRVEVIVGPGI